MVFERGRGRDLGPYAVKGRRSSQATADFEAGLNPAGATPKKTGAS